MSFMSSPTNTPYPSAKRATYSLEENLIKIELTNGSIFCFPPYLAQGLEKATPEQLNDVWICASGNSIHWDALDVDFELIGLLMGIFGTKAWMAELGRKGGQVTSSAKVSAARKNGQKGGRPRKHY